MEIINFLSMTIGLIAVVIIAWGTVSSFVEFAVLEVKRCRGENICRKRETLRHHLGSYLLISLEFLIAADIAPHSY